MFEALAAEIDRLCEMEPQALADGESMVELHRLRSQLDAALTRGVGAFDASGLWACDGAQSAAAWLSTRTHLPQETCRAEVRTGRSLRQMPATEQAWLAGDIDRAHVVALARARGVNEEAFEVEEKALVDEARLLRYSHFSRGLGYWCLRVAPEDAEDDAAGALEARELYLSQSFADHPPSLPRDQGRRRRRAVERERWLPMGESVRWCAARGAERSGSGIPSGFGLVHAGPQSTRSAPTQRGRQMSPLARISAPG